MKQTEWVLCPVCGSKTRNKITSNSHHRARRISRRADEQVSNHRLLALFNFIRF